MAHAASSYLLNHLLVGVTLKPKSREQKLIGPEALNGFLMNNIPLQNKSFWFDIAEIELSALGNQCLAKRRISNVKELNEELAAWNTERNASQKGVNWQFTTDDARIKLKLLYPILNF